MMDMTEQNNPLSFGRFLKSLRIQNDIRLDEISRITRISLDNLAKLEREDHCRLPAPVHVKGFLKAYAQVVGAEPNEVIQRYLADRLAFQKSAGSNASLRSWLGFWPRLLIALVVLAVIIAVSVYSVSYSNRAPQSSVSPVSLVPAAPSAQTAAEAPETSRSSAELTPLAAIKKLMLRVVAVEPTRLKVIIDGQTPKEYQLKPEDRLELEAKSHFNLLMDNATGIRLFLNDQPVQLSGKAGQTATIQLPLRSRE
jgi:cytoskeleton protein RodZ